MSVEQSLLEKLFLFGKSLAKELVVSSAHLLELIDYVVDRRVRAVGPLVDGLGLHAQLLRESLLRDAHAGDKFLYFKFWHA